MRKMVRYTCIMLFLCASSLTRAQMLNYDIKNALNVLKNTALANTQEMAIREEYKKIKSLRREELTGAITNLSNRRMDLDERGDLAAFREENLTYRKAKRTLEEVIENVEYLLRSIRNVPVNSHIYKKAAANLLLSTNECFARMTALGMNIKTKGNDDGSNLLTSIERIELMDNCISELETFNKAIYRIALHLDTEVSWAYRFKHTQSVLSRRIQSLDDAKKEAVRQIQNIRW